LVGALTEWRRSRGITPELEGTYNENMVNRDRNKANKLLQKHYLDKRANKQIRVKTHLLRAIYASAAYDLFSDNSESLNVFINDKLGHDDMEVGLRYAFIKIVPEDQITELPPKEDEEDEEEDDAPEQQEPEEAPKQKPVVNEDDQPVSRKEFKQLLKVNQQLMKSMDEMTALLKLVLQQQPAIAIPAIAAREDNIEEPEPVIRRSSRLRK